MCAPHMIGTWRVNTASESLGMVSFGSSVSSPLGHLRNKLLVFEICESWYP